MADIHRIALAGFVATATLSLATEVRAEGGTAVATASGNMAEEVQSSNFESRPTAILGEFNPFGSPVGVVGAEVERALLPWFVVSGGGGVSGGAGGTSIGSGSAQVAFGARFRGIVSRRFALGVGAGASYGGYTPSCPPEVTADRGGPIPCHPPSADVVWFHPEADFELRFDNGLSLRFAGGLSVPLECGHGDCARAFGVDHASSLAYALGAVGYSF